MKKSKKESLPKESLFQKKQREYKQGILNKSDRKDLKPDDISLNLLVETSQIIEINGPITLKLATRISRQITAMNIDRDKPLWVFIDSPGGSVTAMFRIINDLLTVNPDNTIALVKGLAASAAAVITIFMPHSFMMPDSTMMLHPIRTMEFGQIKQIDSGLKICKVYEEKLYNKIIEKTKRSKSEIEDLLTHDWYLTAQEAVEEGLVNAVPEIIIYENAPRVIFRNEVVTTNEVDNGFDFMNIKQEGGNNYHAHQRSIKLPKQDLLRNISFRGLGDKR